MMVNCLVCVVVCVRVLYSIVMMVLVRCGMMMLMVLVDFWCRLVVDILCIQFRFCVILCMCLVILFCEGGSFLFRNCEMLDLDMFVVLVMFMIVI